MSHISTKDDHNNIFYLLADNKIQLEVFVQMDKPSIFVDVHQQF